MANTPPPPPITTAATTATATSSETEPPPTPPLTNGVLPSPPLLALAYGKCNKNYSATTGGHVLDGCGEFMPSLTPTDPRTFLNCDACGCHRSFHRLTDHPPPSPPNSPSPISSTTPAHMTLLAVNNPQLPQPAQRDKKKRFRTKFSEDQKKKMQEFAERIGWKMLKKDEEMIMGFCMDIGVTKRVLKVWLHNHKNMKTLRST